jgi:hypothetical protein
MEWFSFLLGCCGQQSLGVLLPVVVVVITVTIMMMITLAILSVMTFLPPVPATHC